MRAAAEAVVARAASQMGRSLDTDGIKELLQSNPDHPRWDEVAERCLTCGNCTMVCPTCFCTTVEDHSDLTGTIAERVRKWDSCFTLDFSYLHGGSVRIDGPLALPAMDDPQARQLVRSIRHLGLCRLRPLHHLVSGGHRHHAGSRRHPRRPRTRARENSMEGLEQILAEHPFFAGFSAEHSRLVAGCARNHRYDAGEYLFREGDAADEFFLIRHGQVALEIVRARTDADRVCDARRREKSSVPPGSSRPIAGCIDARAMTLTRAIGIDAACLRGKCEADHHLGYEMMKRFLPILVQRLHATRLQILDVYGKR